MPGIVGVGAPSLSEIQAWDVTHLEDAAGDWTASAQHWEASFTSIHRTSVCPGGTVWEGVAAEAAQERAFADLVKVRRLADVLHESAAVARRGAETLTYAKRSVLDAVEDAQAAGYAVSENLSVAPPPRTGLVGAAQAQVYAADVRERAVQLAVHDKEIAAKISAATAPLNAVSFPESPAPAAPPSVSHDRKRKIQAVDQHTIKQSPSAPSPPNDPQQARDDYDKLKDEIKNHNLRPPMLNDSNAVNAYNREADALNAKKAALEGKLGVSETAPARLDRFVPDWTQPAPEQPHTLPPTPERPQFDLTTPHAHDLGTDPAIGGKFRPNEAETALRVETEKGIDLVRNSHGGADWINPATGETYDAVGNFPSSFFDSQWSNLQEEILEHLKYKAEYVPVDVTQFTAEQRSIVRAFVEGLKNSYVFVVGDN